MSSPVPSPPVMSADAAARALQECFLANADRGDNAANDELVAELVRRIRALRASTCSVYSPAATVNQPDKTAARPSPIRPPADGY